MYVLNMDEVKHVSGGNDGDIAAGAGALFGGIIGGTAGGLAAAAGGGWLLGGVIYDSMSLEAQIELGGFVNWIVN